MDREQFINMLNAAGFREMVEVTREPGGMLESHVHSFEAKALILDGEIRIATAAGERVYRTGDIFHLQQQEPHSETYGAHGVRYLVGRI